MAEPFTNNDMLILHLCSREIVLFIDALCAREKVYLGRTFNIEEGETKS